MNYPSLQRKFPIEFHFFTLPRFLPVGPTLHERVAHSGTFLNISILFFAVLFLVAP